MDELEDFIERRLFASVGIKLARIINKNPVTMEQAELLAELFLLLVEPREEK